MYRFENFIYTITIVFSVCPHSCIYVCVRVLACLFIYVYIYISCTGHWNNGSSVRQWPGRPGFTPWSSHTKDSKNASLLNSQHYKVRIKGKVEQSRERSSTLPCTSMQQQGKKEPSGHPRLKGDNFTNLCIYPLLPYLLSKRRFGFISVFNGI